MPRPQPRTAPRLTVLALGAALAVGFLAAPAGAAKKPPVKLSGTVSNEGVGKVRDGAVAIEADSFFFDKTFLKSTAGSVEVTIENGSSVPHTFTIDSLDIDEQLAPGAKKTVTVAVAAGDPVVFYCRFHRSSGMQGAFFTKKGAATTGASTASGGGSDPY